MQAFGRYKITQPIETSSIDSQGRPVYHFRVAVVDDPMGKVAREFRASDLDEVRAALRAVDEMLRWLKDVAATPIS